MKRIISVIVVLTVVASSCLFAITAVARYTDFTLYCNPAVETVSEDHMGDICVSIKLENNPGVWAMRLFVVYPEGLSLDDGYGCADVTNPGGVFSAAETLTVSTPDLNLDDISQPREFKQLMLDKGIVKEGYRSLNIYFESDSLNSMATSDGILLEMYFHLTDAAVTGDELSVQLYYGEQDVIGVGGSISSPVFTAYSPDTYGSVISVAGCTHQSTYIDRKEAGCITSGYEKEICSFCEKVLSEAIITQKGHSYVTVTEEATCAKEGTKKKLCSVCRGDETVLETYPIIPHSYEETVVPPTNTDYGYTLHTCSACGDEYKDNYVDPNAAKGDVNLDGKVNSLDTNLVKRYITGSHFFGEVGARVADVNGDGFVNAIDINQMIKFIVGYTDKLE